MSKIWITRGLPGSGKSTWAREMAALFKGTVIVERDELRYLCTGAYWTGDTALEERVTRLQEGLIRRYIGEGLTVIISDTNLPDRSVKRWQKLALELGTEVLVQDFRDVPLVEVLRQNAKRPIRDGKTVPAEVITDKYNRFIKGRDLTKEVVYTPPVELEIEPYVPKSFAKPAVIFDIDGTLAIMGDRSPYDGAAVWKDTVNKDVLAALNNAELAGYFIIIVSGRDEVYHEVTEKWLADNGVYYDMLYMRPTEQGNKREDSIIKYELFNKHIRDRFNVAGVYDDRHRVLRMWRKLGLTTFHVNGPDAGNF